ncbi:MAG TPA: transcription-repair coupling factor [candidate division Zixibacteria bacterium]|nr:transcription-repair coupling factor [candidate division Zixibacteria bacterium]
MKAIAVKENRRIDAVAARFTGSDRFLKLIERIRTDVPDCVTVTGLAGSTPSLLISSLYNTLTRPILVVTEGPDEASHLYDDLAALMGENQVGHFPARQILPYDFRAPVGEILGRRISTLSTLVSGHLPVTVCSVRSLMEPTIDIDFLRSSQVSFRRGAEIDLDDLIDRLVQLGYRRVPIVEEVGDFAVRGGLIDLFTPGAESPIRVELFGDEVDTIREFDVATQRTTGRIDEVSLLPKREIPITQDTLENYLERLPQEDGDFIRLRYLNDPELPGLEWLSILFGMKSGRLTDYLPDNCLIYFQAEGNLRTAAEVVMDEAETLRKRLTGRLSRLPNPEEYYTPPEILFTGLAHSKRIDQVPFRGGRADIIDFGCQSHPSLGSRLDLLGETVREFEALGLTYFVATDTEGQAARLAELIADKSGLDFDPPLDVINLHGGFVNRRDGYAVLTDHEIFSRYHRRIRRKKFKEGVAISDYANLNPGDFVVHTEYGIARYLGLKTITVDQKNRDCLLLQYAEKDKLYVPIEEFNRVSKYSGKDSAPALTRLGGPAWEKLKKKTKKAIADMAADLIKLYAERRAQAGYNFGPDTVWLKQLETSFPYDETPDQMKAINDVKRDMAEDKPMDRLICGDVGYGKTEVAVRAAFKAVEQGKQVAVLVPTTILAQQHFQTFSERLHEFPVRVEMLSRFKTRKEQLEIVDELAEGKVDLVIGTHRLFSKDVFFKDLGLLIVDEEHRFGVRHKEKLRQLKASVDTISMTATPIPRTLQMALMGARDMSLITTSPKDRLPISTEVVEFDPAIIATAVLREIDRGGQVFFVHNRVQTIEAMYRYLKKVVPQAEIGIAHGQMHEKSLEGIMLAFMSGRYNVLLCTSIIESGLDIPSANTIIINRADRFGLAQLYQIRGRVGRSARRAYAYLLSPPTRLMSADAVKRLRALEAHSDLGSGFALAMRDLEIRGAGTILGARQSGFIEEIGYDMYTRLLEEAIAEVQGKQIHRLPEVKMELDAELHLSDRYINDRHQKVDIYRRLADCTTLDAVEKLRDEVRDRFGRLPRSADNLFDAAAVKVSAAVLEMEKVKLKRGMANLFFKPDRKLERREVEALRKATDQPMEFSLIGHPQVMIDLSSVNAEQRLSYLRGVLGKI